MADSKYAAEGLVLRMMEQTAAAHLRPSPGGLLSGRRERPRFSGDELQGIQAKVARPDRKSSLSAAKRRACHNGRSRP